MDSKQFILGIEDAHGASYANLLSLMARSRVLLGAERVAPHDPVRRAALHVALQELFSDLSATLYSELQERSPGTIPSAEQTLRFVDQYIALAEREVAADRGAPFTNQ